jgi:short-subunit dehydrogenase
MHDWWREQLARRPAWMNALFLFSAYMTFLYVPWDLFVKPVAEDVQVWFGVPFHGWVAKLTTPVHGGVYALATYGFWRMRRWMWPWAALYAGYLGSSVLIWSLREQGGAGGLVLGLVSATALGLLAVGLWRSRALFEAQAPPLRERYGEWALVTGASSGIGAAFARALAREGISVVLTARREARLRELAADLEKTHGVATRIVAADLSCAGEPERLADAVSGLEIAFLVNNAGFGYQGRFEKQDGTRLCDMVQVNCVAPLVLTLRLLTGMRERARGAVIFTGSVAGRQPLPLHAVYAATKGFDQLLGEALWAELRASGIDVLVLEPGTTETEFQQRAGEVPHPGRPPEEVVACALEALGRQPSVISDWFNWLRINAGTRLLPRSLLALVAERIAEARTRPEMR